MVASKMEQYAALIDQSVAYAKEHASGHQEVLQAAMDRLFVVFGKEILKTIPGRVSTEVDARLSFDTQASIDRALGLIAQYEKEGISKDRILIKLASTWEGIRAAKYGIGDFRKTFQLKNFFKKSSLMKFYPFLMIFLV